MKWSHTRIKNVIFAVNLFFVIGGFFLISLGVGLIMRYSDPTLPETDFVQFWAALSIIVGFITFIFSFLGCYGSTQENFFMLFVYSLFMIVNTIGMIILANVVFFSVKILVAFASYLPLHSMGNFEKPISFNALFERDIQCCIISGANELINDYRGDVIQIPYSCCDPKSIDFYTYSHTCTNYKVINKCLPTLVHYLSQYSFYFGSFFMVVAIAEFFTTVSAIYLTVKALKKIYKRLVKWLTTLDYKGKIQSAFRVMISIPPWIYSKLKMMMSTIYEAYRSVTPSSDKDMLINESEKEEKRTLKAHTDTISMSVDETPTFKENVSENS